LNTIVAADSGARACGAALQSRVGPPGPARNLCRPSPSRERYIGENETVAVDNFTGSNIQRTRELRPGEGERMELSVFRARVHALRESVHQR